VTIWLLKSLRPVTPVISAISSVTPMAAEMERDLIRQRTMHGLRAAQAQGRCRGRPAAVNDDVLAIARARLERGESVTAIARHLRVGRSTLYRTPNL
jgi:DNA invertase Pin-like site-specific DNA recombinase